MKKESSPEFIALQKEWYDKLRECGFDDIEVMRGARWDLKQESSRILRKDRPHGNSTVRQVNAEYYRELGEWLNDPATVFRSQADRLIMEMQADGCQKNDIFLALCEAGHPKSLATIRFIIRRYEEKWGLMTYAMNQMNRYPKKPTK